MDKVIVCKLMVQRTTQQKTVNLSCFVKMNQVTPTYGSWERYSGDLTFPNFITQGVWFWLPGDELIFSYEIATQDPNVKTTPRVVSTSKVDINFWEKITPQFSLLGRGFILPIEKCEWMLGFALPNNLPH